MKTIKDIKQMIREPASKEWFAKHGSPKGKALSKAKPHYEKVKTTGGPLNFMTKHHPERIKHEAREKERQGRKENYDKWRNSL